MGQNILNRTGQNILETASSNLYKSTGGILGKESRLAKPWPQSSVKSRGFLPPFEISPTDSNDPIADGSKLSEFNIKDWRGHLLDADERSDRYLEGVAPFDTLDKIQLSKIFPTSSSRLDESKEVDKPGDFSPYSIRDVYKIFNDSSTDYFKHGIYIDRQNLNNESGNFYSTPEENNDPVIFGFDLIIDVETSPLLNGSINDFLTQFSSIEEINSKISVYEDFKTQFIKLFKTTTNVSINDSDLSLLNNTGTDNINTIANSDESGSLTYGKKAYMSYYLKKVEGLKNLSESNGSGSFKYLVDYRKDIIRLNFLEDVSLTMGTLANLYKLLYWSKPNGKGIIPENLLRFNCKIIVSELRNFNRVKASSSRVDIIKDNLSRYVYDLKECQLFFDSRPHEDAIDNTTTDVYSDYSISFDYKFSTVKYEKWKPSISNYNSYNDGSMWDSNGNEFIPFDDEGTSLRGNGYDKDFIIKNYTTSNSERGSEEDVDIPVNQEATSFDRFKQAAKKSAIKLAQQVKQTVENEAKSQLQLVVNSQVALLNNSLNKALNAVAGTQGIKPPTNIYTQNTNRLGRTNSRVFYDVRGQLSDFAGDALSGILGGG